MRTITNFIKVPTPLVFLFKTIEEFQVFYLFLKKASATKNDYCVFNINSSYQEVGDLKKSKAKRAFQRLIDLKIIENIEGYKYRFTEFFFNNILSLKVNDYTYKTSDELECELFPNKIKECVEDTNKTVKRIEEKVEKIDKKLDKNLAAVEDFFKKKEENAQDFEEKYGI